MAIDVVCTGCGRTLTVGPEHAGKMARCPVCSHITPVSTEASVGSSYPSAIAPAPAAALDQWYMRTPEAQEYGPASRDDLDRWVAEGRVTADCQLREGVGGLWLSADQIFPALKPVAPIPVWTPPAPVGGQGTAPSPGKHPVARPTAIFPPPGGSFAQAAPAYQMPHRGALILVLGLMGFFTGCAIFSLIAWVLGSNDLREMEAGRMDRSGRDITRAGMILGMILSILWILGFVALAGLFFLAALAG